jgi:hypothetical protein
MSDYRNPAIRQDQSTDLAALMRRDAAVASKRARNADKVVSLDKLIPPERVIGHLCRPRPSRARARAAARGGQS